MTEEYLPYLKRAKQILADNWAGKFTLPSSKLYPHQWSWDSGFVAIGYSRYDQARAQLEIKTLFDAQWKNGMIPQIVFNPSALGNYFPEPDFWQADKSPDAPKGKLTSGITMPPIHATACRAVFEKADNREEAKEFLKEMFPKLKKSHEYLYRYRDPKNEGLIYIRHPWESGLDNSPTWDGPLKAISFDRSRLPKYKRKDLKKGVPGTQRPSDENYDRYVFLVDLFRKNRYDEKRIEEACPFKLQDILFNSVLSRANKDLVFIASVTGDDSAEISEWEKKTSSAICKKLWHDEHGIFDDYDLYGEKLIEVDTASGFLPLFSRDASNEQAKKLYNYLESVSFCAMHQGGCFSIPNYNMKSDEFDPSNYWRGPIWINMNWILYHGLKYYGFMDKSKSVMEDILELVKRFGFHEYFDPYEGTGYGSDNFTWTSALFIDTFYDLKSN